MLDEKDLQAIGQLMDTKLLAQKRDILSETGQMMDTRMDTRFAGFAERMDAKLAEQKRDILTETTQMMDAKFADFTKEVDSKLSVQKKEIMSESTHNMNLLFENLFTPRFNLLAEGQQDILDKLVPRARVDDLEDEVKFLKSIVRQMNEDIQQLKKAN